MSEDDCGVVGIIEKIRSFFMACSFLIRYVLLRSIT